MSVEDPRLDPRGYDDVVAETEALARAELAAVQLAWERPPGAGDMASALIRIFARMAQHVIDNLNQVPNQQLLAFLNLIGAQRTPPRPARAPLSFQLSEGAPSEAVVPAGTRVSSPPAEGEVAEVVFETEAELVVSKARLAVIALHEPDRDRYHVMAADGEGAAAEGAPLAHDLFIDGGDLFTLPPEASLAVIIGLPPAAAPAWESLPLAMASWDGAGYQPIDAVRTIEEANGARAQIMTFTLPAAVARGAVGGREGRWIRARLTTPMLGGPLDAAPSVHGIDVRASLSRGGLAADAASSGDVPVDLSLDFRPFGERPHIGDAFFLASSEALSKGGATVTLTITKSQAALAPKSEDDPVLAWEVWTSSGWIEIGRSSRASASLKPLAPSLADVPHTGADPSPHAFYDATLALTSFDAEGRGVVSFTAPHAAAPRARLGVTSLWLRVRILKGQKLYGTGLTLVTQTIQIAGPNNTSVDVPVSVPLDDGYRPPVLASVALGYAHDVTAPAQGVVTYNDFRHLDRTAESAARTPFAPFTRAAGDGDTFYFGFDPGPSNRPTSMFVEVAQPPPFEVSASALLLRASVPTPPVLVWEYATERGYVRLDAEDETGGLRRTGIVRFMGPKDMIRTSELGVSLSWIRARVIRGAPQRISRAVLNTVWAQQAVTITGEALGSSGGARDQAFSLASRPVLPGQEIQVREPATPAGLAREAVEPALDEDGVPIGVWVTWMEVCDFHASGPNDRHYLLDRSAGEIRFGDGARGLVPPPGTANVRAKRYRAGGGALGDRPRGAIRDLRTTIASVKGVENIAPSSGGVDMGSVEALKDEGPRALRHGAYAITVEDYEDLAREASSDVARARAVTPASNPLEPTPATSSLAPGAVLVIVVPRGEGPRPSPSIALLDDVRGALIARCPPAVSLWVSGPDWVRVTVSATISARSIEVSERLAAEALAAVERYLHPLRGGPLGRGWELGRLPRGSDIYPILTTLDGADYVSGLSLAYHRETAPSVWASLPSDISEDELRRALIFSGDHAITIDTGGG